MSDNNKTLIACEGCGEEFEMSNLTKTDSGYFCEDCFENNYIKCEDCGDVVAKDDAHQTYSGGWICEDCRENYFYCDKCDGLFPEDETTYIESEGVCVCGHCLTNNYTRCENCGEYVADNDTIVTANGDAICRDCYENNYLTCDGCGEIYHESYCSSTDGGVYCRDCFQDHEEQDNDNLHNYGYKPSLNFHKTSDDPQSGNLYFGIELEQSHADCGDRDNNVDSCLDILNDYDENNVFLKEDSSLNRGFEMVSHPRTLNSWHEFFPKIEEYFEQAQNYNDGKNNGASDGLHIHISRKGMSTPHIIRFGAFIAACQDEITILARRTSDQWAKHYKKPETAHDCRETASQYSRYVAVNWCNSSTVELRVFRSTLDVIEFYAAIEFAHAAYQFTKNCINIVQIINNNPWQDFMAYVKNNERYSRLVEFFARVEHNADNA